MAIQFDTTATIIKLKGGEYLGVATEEGVAKLFLIEPSDANYEEVSAWAATNNVKIIEEIPAMPVSLLERTKRDKRTEIETAVSASIQNAVIDVDVEIDNNSEEYIKKTISVKCDDALVNTALFMPSRVGKTFLIQTFDGEYIELESSNARNIAKSIADYLDSVARKKRRVFAAIDAADMLEELNAISWN